MAVWEDMVKYVGAFGSARLVSEVGQDISVTWYH